MSIKKHDIDYFIQGKQEAIEKVYFEYKNLIFFIVSTYVENKDDVEDLVNESFLKLLENKTKILNKGNLKTYLVSISKNLAIDYLRKRKKEIYIESIDDLYGEEDSSNNLLNTIEPYLNNKEAIIVCYRIVFKYSWKELAEITGIPNSSARLIYSRAIKKLRSQFNNSD